MSDKSRYKKLAAAKKKLKEYNQSKEKLTEQGLPSSSVDNGLSQLNISSGGMKSSSLSGLLDLTEEIKALNGENNVKELLPNGSNLLLTGNKAQSNEQIKDVREFFSQQKETPFLESCAVTASATTKESPTVNSIENDNQKKPEHQSASNAIPVDPIKMDAINRNVSNHSASTAKMDNTVEILISERATLNAKLSELQTSCKEKDLEIEELNIRLDGALKRLDSFERLSLEQKEENNNLKTKLNELKTEVFLKDDELKKSKLQSTDNSEYIEELKRELKLQREKMQSFGEELKNKETQIDILNIRLQQVSDESSVAIDNRVEDLTQTKFQYEKRIQDLQAIIEQLQSERDQANQQYQNYVQHLSKEVTSLTEKNIELNAENNRLQDREKSLVDHVSQLERQIQQQITRQQNLNENIPDKEKYEEIIEQKTSLEERVKILENDRNTFEEQINHSKNVLNDLNQSLKEKDMKIKDLEGQMLENLSYPDNTRILEIMESDKVAASRAQAQNEELKKQVFELESKLVQVINDKAELTDQLYSERHENKEIQKNFSKLNEDVKTLDEKLHFKDEEMIRLTHENSELNKEILRLNQQMDRLKHYEAKEYTEYYVKQSQYQQQQKQQQENTMSHQHNKGEDNSETSHENVKNDNQENALLKEENEVHGVENDLKNYPPQMKEKEYERNKMEEDQFLSPNGLPTAEAMHRLESRFKTLMNEVAELTDEKQRLEHLVLQLQGETETIGEYITLYQTQRRMLKQREIEKNAHLIKLQAERDELRGKISELMRLMDLLKTKQTNFNEIVTAANNEILPFITDDGKQENLDGQINTTNNVGSDGNHPDKKNLKIPEADSHDPSKIIKNITNILADIKEKANNDTTELITVDHCACCSGKFETI